MKKLDLLIHDAIAPSCKKNNFFQHKIICEWQDIVGTELAKICVPIETHFGKNKEADGTLIIGVKNPAYVLKIQMMEQTIVQRLFTYFGYNAIKNIRSKYVPYYT